MHSAKFPARILKLIAKDDWYTQMFGVEISSGNT